MSYKYYLGPWQWQVAPMPCWTPPPGTVGLVDLGSLVDLASAAGSPRKVGFFAVNDAVVLPSEYTLLGQGDCRSLLATTAMQSAWQSLVGYRPQGQYLVDLLWDQLTTGSDPDGQTACLPLVPGADGWLDLCLAGHSRVRAERFEWGRPASKGTQHTPKLRALLRNQFRRWWTQSQDQARRCLDFLCDQYGLQGAKDWQEFVPPDLLPHVPGRLPHSTTITESFNTTNGSPLGPDLSWVVVSGTWRVESNMAGKNATQNGQDLARANSPLSSADHYAQIVREDTTTGTYQGPCCRVDGSGAHTFYTTVCDGTLYLQKDVSGSQTNFATTTQGVAAGDTYKVQASGSTISAYVNGVQKLSATDTAIAGNLYGGITQFAAADSTLDNFQAGDLGGGAGIVYTQLERSVRGLNRGTYFFNG